MELLFSSDVILGFLTLVILEIVLGIDNIIFIAVISNRLPEAQRQKARQLGLLLAMFMRLGLLASISWIISLKEPVFHLWDHGVSFRDIILLTGGLFLIAKSVYEINETMEEADAEKKVVNVASFSSALIQILLLDIIFSLDSVITAVGMVNQLPVMMAAVIISVLVMMVFANPISEFILKHPSLKMLALSFLILIGFVLVADGMGKHIEKGYVYFAIGFSMFVEFLNLRLRARKPAG